MMSMLAVFPVTVGTSDRVNVSAVKAGRAELGKGAAVGAGADLAQAWSRQETKTTPSRPTERPVLPEEHAERANNAIPAPPLRAHPTGWRERQEAGRTELPCAAL